MKGRKIDLLCDEHLEEVALSGRANREGKELQRHIAEGLCSRLSWSQRRGEDHDRALAFEEVTLQVQSVQAAKRDSPS